MFFLSESRKVGLGLCGFGVFLYFLGFLLFFDRILLAFANVAFFGGINFILGPHNSTRFFFRRKKLKGSLCCFVGFLLIILRWPSLGFFFQIYGIWILFRALLPNILSSLKLTPLGFLFNLPGLRTIADWIYDQRRLPL